MPYRNKASYTIVLFLLIAIFLLAFSLFSYSRTTEEAFATAKFHTLIQKYARAIERKIRSETHILNGLAAYHYASVKITRNEFKDFSDTILSVHEDVVAIGWIPQIAEKERVSYERAAKNDGIENFSLKDIISEHILSKARDTKKVVVSAPIKLLQDDENSLSIVVYYPVYSEPHLKEKFVGAYVIVLRVDKIMQASIEEVSSISQDVKLKVYDTVENKIIYDELGRYDKDELSDIKASAYGKLPTRKWRVEATATKQFTSEYLTSYPYILFATTIGILLLIVWIFYLHQRRFLILANTNEQMRRFQRVAIGRERRIVELKNEINVLKETQRSDDEKS